MLSKKCMCWWFIHYWTTNSIWFECFMWQFNVLSHCDMVMQKMASHLCFIIFILLLWEVPRQKSACLMLSTNNLIIQIDVLCDQSDIFSLTCSIHFTQSTPGVLQSISGLPNMQATKKLCAALNNQSISTNTI